MQQLSYLLFQLSYPSFPIYSAMQTTAPSLPHLNRCKSANATNRFLHHPPLPSTSSTSSLNQKSLVCTILVSLNNSAALPWLAVSAENVWPQMSWMTSLLYMSHLLLYIFIETCSVFSNQRVAMPRRESLHDRTGCYHVRTLVFAGLLCSSWALWIFIPTAAFVTFTDMAALSSPNHCRNFWVLLSDFHLTLKSYSDIQQRFTLMCHKGADKEMKSAGHSVAILLC